MPRLDRDPEELKWRCGRRWGPRQWWQCVYCGDHATEADHFSPYWIAHDSTAKNLVPACPRCNREKSGHDPKAWMTAVGVPKSSIKFLLAIAKLPNWRKRPDSILPRTSLDYAPGRLLEDIPGQKRSKKGKLG